VEIVCKPLEDVLNILKVLCVDVVSIIPTTDGWEFYARDPSNCSMAMIMLKKEVFSDDYDVWEPFAVDMEYLSGMIAKKKVVNLVVKDGFVHITYEKSRSKSPLKILDDTPRQLPKIDLTNSDAVVSDGLSGLAKEKFFSGASNCDLGLTVEITEEALTMSYDSQLGAYLNSIDTILSDLPDGKQIAHFDPDLLLPVLKVLPPGLPMAVSLETDRPIKLVLNTATYIMTIFVAPRIDA
jgi:hypothetical protein